MNIIGPPKCKNPEVEICFRNYANGMSMGWGVGDGGMMARDAHLALNLNFSSSISLHR